MGAAIFASLAGVSHASLTELDFEFGYSRRVYGVGRENKETERTYSASLAQYFLSLTAIEVSYSDSEKIITENQRVELTDVSASVTGTQYRVVTRTYGIGLRQALAPRGSFIRPLVSMGYAKQFVKYQNDITYELDNGTVVNVYGGALKSRRDYAFGTFSLQIRVTRGFSLKGSVKTMIPAFETEKARDNLEYLAGFTWMF